MEVEDDRLVGGEQAVEFALGQPCGCSVAGCSLNRSTTLTNRSFKSGDCSRSMAAAASASIVATSPQRSQHHVGLLSRVSTGPRQMPRPFVQWTIASSMVGELQMLLLVRHDDVDVVGAAQAVIRDRQQRVRVRRQIDARHRRALVGHQVDEAGILVREPVVVLPPDGRRSRMFSEATAARQGTWFFEMSSHFAC